MLVSLAGCGGGGDAGNRESAARGGTSWEETERRARGQTVTLSMWQGDPYINAYMKSYVIPALKERYGIALNIVGGQGNNLVSTLMTEMEAGDGPSAYDMMWINGETFYQLRQIKALYGPFVDRLPNARYVDFGNRFINTDFQQPVDGYESPWGNVQLAIIYDTNRVPDPPGTMVALEKYVRSHPGKFTFDNSFTGMTFLKCLLIDLAGGERTLAGKFNEDLYRRYSAMLWEYLNRIKPYFWKQGRSFPAEVAQLHQMFAGGEIDFSMSNNDGEVDNKILQGLFSGTARAYVLDSGTIQNSHFMGIARHSAHPDGAMVVANFLISPEAQLRKLDPNVWGDGTVLDMAKLPEEWRGRFAALPGRRYAPPRSAIQSKALMELAPEYMIRLSDDFRKNVIEK
ncbi:MAG: Protein ynjB [Chlorobi bacterium]|nr:Protein ynjB [Chlorobiota bacterium]